VGGRRRSIILTSSAVGLKAIPNTGHYNSAKHGMAGLMRTLALELAPDEWRYVTGVTLPIDAGVLVKGC
jgi:NAD(P)-dependent dehydrogenase (short-subunit alcohol dehydrogenase family)